MKYLTIHTISPRTNDPRNVTLELSDTTNKVYLLGNLEHNTEILLDQTLVTSLQIMLDTQNIIKE